MKKKPAQNLIEYALILALITLVSFIVLNYISRQMGFMFDNTGTKTPFIQTNTK